MKFKSGSIEYIAGCMIQTVVVNGVKLYHVNDYEENIYKFQQYLDNRLWEQYGENVELVEKSLRMNFGGEDVR